ncbi:MAG: hypothetical protein ACPG32_09170 [Akkermansiaceae bacterium]
MKTFTLITCALAIATPLFAKAPKAIPQNQSRKLVDQFSGKMFSAVGDLTRKKPRAKVPTLTLDGIGKAWSPHWQVSKDGKTMITRYQPKDDQRLVLGQAIIKVTTTPFKAKLKTAPNVQDEAVAIEFEVQRWVSQKWKVYKLPALKQNVRGFVDMQGGGADNAMLSTEPFSFTDKAGKTYWCMVSIETARDEKKGLTLQKVLNALKF